MSEKLRTPESQLNFKMNRAEVNGIKLVLKEYCFVVKLSLDQTSWTHKLTLPRVTLDNLLNWSLPSLSYKEYNKATVYNKAKK